jgi:signal peptidase I
MSNNNPVTEFIDNLIVEIKQFIKDSLVNLAVLMAIVTFIVNITATPTTSMYPTVKKGDIFLLLKFPYGFNLRSFDVGPIGISHNYFWKNIFTYIPQKKLAESFKLS